MSGQPGQRSRFWTAEEREILEREYPTGGFRAVQALLPHRTLNQIRAAAMRWQIQVAGRTYVKQPTTEWIDAAIQRAYRTAEKSPDLRALAKALGRTKGWVKWRAQVLGVQRPYAGALGKPHTAWSPEEDQLLEDLLERGLTVSGIHNHFRRKGFQRSIHSILSRTYDRELGFDRAWWTARETARALNLDEGVILRWIEKGALKATRAHGPTADHKTTTATQWAIQRQDLRRFLTQNPHAWDHRRVRIEILLEMLCFDRSHGALGAFAGTAA